MEQYAVISVQIEVAQKISNNKMNPGLLNTSYIMWHLN